MSKDENKKGSIKKILLWVVITNIITISALVFLPIPIFGMKLVSSNDYKFLYDYRKLASVHNILDKKYVDKISPEKESKMVEGAIKGMTQAVGDPYTTYMDAKEFESFMTQATGSYPGVGLLITVEDNKVVVAEPIEDGPALKAGFKSGDVIVAVNGTEVKGDNTKAATLMKGEEGTEVTITIDRKNEGKKDIKVKREHIQLKTVKSEVVDDIGYVRIASFDEATGKEFKENVDALMKKGIKGLVLDLRENPGGILDESIKVLDVFIDNKVVLSTVDNGGKKTEYKTEKGKINVPFAVLVNKGSASASEIVSGAIKDLKAGKIVGTTTYGKGLVQATTGLKDGTGLKFTVSRYYTPSGISIQGKGIEPDIVVDIPKDTKITGLKDDPQFKKAVEAIKSE